ncbi:MAG: AMP-binding protein [Deltaproteobacteria bacterium]|nr:AMP-binding protein [Deltaproteobacteria bacterium]
MTAHPHLPRALQRPETTIVDVLEWRAQREPDRTAYVFLRDGERDEVRLTYAELAAQARAVAQAVRHHAEPGDRVLLAFPSGLDFVTAFFGTLYAGCVPVPTVPPEYRKIQQALRRLLAIVDNARPTVGLTTSGILSMVQAGQVGGVDLPPLAWVASDDLGSAGHALEAAPSFSAEDLAFLQYTSGSTGKPRGVAVSHRNLMANLEMLGLLFKDHLEKPFVSWLPLFHDFGLILKTLGALYSNCPCIVMSPLHFVQRPARWLEAITRYRAAVSGGPNFAFDLCVRKVTPEERAGLDLSSWRGCPCAAEPIRTSTLDAFVETFGPVGFDRSAYVPGWGLAEAVVMVSGKTYPGPPRIVSLRAAALEQGRVELCADGEEARPIVGCGLPVGDAQDVHLVDPETCTEVPADRIGELWVAGPQVTRGYWQREAETEQIFHNYLADGRGPYLRTGDLAFLREGELYITGRLKDLVIVNGRNLYPHDVEATCERAHPAVRPSCVAAFGLEGAVTERLAIVCEVQRSCPPEEHAAVVSALRTAVAAEHDVTVHALAILAPGTIPKTSSGKIQRRESKARFEKGTLEELHRFTEAAERKGAKDAAASATSELGELLSAVGREARGELVAAFLRQTVAELLGLAEEGSLPADRPLKELGLTSLKAKELQDRLSRTLGRALPATLAYDHPTLEELGRHLLVELGESPREAVVAEAVERRAVEPVALLGFGCRFPGGVSDAESFWRLLEGGVDAISHVPASRFPVERYYRAERGVPGKLYTREGGFLDDVEGFDAPFFHLAPREVQAMDPQQRLLLEVAWEALEQAGIAVPRLRGSRTGVFVGLSTHDYAGRLLAQGNPGLLDAHFATGTSGSVAAGRLAYQFGLEGPALVVDTACSSSLVALHLACQSLRAGESDLALVGGVNLILGPEASVAMCQLGALSPDGRCKAFSARADGYGRAEGCAVVVLKRLSAARRDGDPILALVRGSAVNQDGASNGLTAPSGAAQERVMADALSQAQLAPAEVAYVEAHGTGTELGDPIEVQALARALGAGRKLDEPLYIGSVKSNLGHTEAAAGLAGLLKTVLALRHGTLPRTLHVEEPSPHLPWGELPVAVVREARAFPERPGAPRVAGVSSFGFSGTNAHVVLEGVAPERGAAPEVTASERGPQLLPLTARSPEALRVLAGRVAAELRAHPERALADLAHTAGVGRAAFPERLALLARDSGEAAEALEKWLATAELEAGSAGRADGAPRVAFLFTGQGSQRVGMGRSLYESAPVFRAALERAAGLADPWLPRPLLEVLFPADPTERALHETRFTQPGLFALEHALFALWASLGIRPALVLGHSVGELVAACAAEVLSLEEAMAFTCERARLMQELGGGDGAMAAFRAPIEVVEAALRGRAAALSIAAHNAPHGVVVSGRRAALEEVVRELAQDGVDARYLEVSHAFHSPLMEPVLEPLARAAERLRPRPARVPLVENVSGQLAGPGFGGAAYWRTQARERVRFADGMETLLRQGCTHVLELGPHPVLSTLGALTTSAGSFLPSLAEGREDWSVVLSSLAELFVSGAPVEFAGLDPARARRRVPFASYPFERTRYPLEASSARSPSGPRGHATGHPLLGTDLEQPRPTYEARLDCAELPYLADHRLGELPVFAAAAYLEVGLAVIARGERGSGPVALEGVEFRVPLSLAEPQRLQVALDAEGRLELHARAADEGATGAGWTLHAVARRAAGPSAAEPPSSGPSAAEARQACPEQIEPSVYYEALATQGLPYGPAFRSVNQLFRGPGQAFARLVLPEAAGSAALYGLHPALLDGCIQLLGLAAEARPGDGARDVERIYVPTQLARLRLLRPAGRVLEAWLQVAAGPAAGPRLEAQARLFGEDGALVATLEGLVVQGVARASLLGNAGRGEAAQGETKRAELRRQLEPLPRAQREERLRSEIVRLVRQVMLLGPEAPFDPGLQLMQAGLDSVMAVDLTRRLSALLGERLAVTELYNYPTAAALARRVLDGLFPTEVEPSAETVTASAVASAEEERLRSLAAELEELSEAETAALLAEKLARLGEG